MLYRINEDGVYKPIVFREFTAKFPIKKGKYTDTNIDPKGDRERESYGSRIKVKVNPKTTVGIIEVSDNPDKRKNKTYKEIHVTDKIEFDKRKKSIIDYLNFDLSDFFETDEPYYGSDAVVDATYLGISEKEFKDSIEYFSKNRKKTDD